MSTPTLYLDGRVAVHAGDCAAVIKTLADNSIDAVCTDPPYALMSSGPGKRFANSPRSEATEGSAAAPYQRTGRGFMGKTWDNGSTAFSVDFWAEVWRVLKPGGFAAAFSGTRSYHQLAAAIENAGFEIRDQCKFDHESSTEMKAFLDSLNDEQYAQFRKLNETDALGQLAFCYGTGFPKSHDVSKGIDKAAGQLKHQSVGFSVAGKTGRMGTIQRQELRSDHPEYQPYTSATAAARAWEGWGTALKPAWEPICLARKPLSEGTVAANVLRWGTGALNINACRVETDPSVDDPRLGGNGDWSTDKLGYGGAKRDPNARYPSSALGRWPANLVHDGSAEVLAAFPDSESSIASDRGKRTAMFSDSILPDGGVRGHTDSGGSAARFFASFPQDEQRFWYGAKADSDSRLGSRHPTIKPVALLRWLCRIVTPPGGMILDPFAGTGTTGEAAYREGFNAVLIEREVEYLSDIARRMALAAEGQMTRKHESAKARAVGKAPDHGPLFGGIEVASGRQIYGKFADQIGRLDQRGSNGEDP